MIETKGEHTCVQSSEKRLETVLALRQALFLALGCDLSTVASTGLNGML